LSTVLTSIHKKNKILDNSLPESPVFYSPQFLMDMMNLETGKAYGLGCCGMVLNDPIGGNNLVNYLQNYKLPSINTYPVQDHSNFDDDTCENRNTPLSSMGVNVPAYTRHVTDLSNTWYPLDKNPFKGLKYKRYSYITRQSLIEKIGKNGPLNIGLWTSEGKLKEYLRVLLMGSGFVTSKNCGEDYSVNHMAVIYGRKIIRNPNLSGFGATFRKSFNRRIVDSWLIRNSWDNPDLFYDASTELTCGVGKDVEVFSKDP